MLGIVASFVATNVLRCIVSSCLFDTRTPIETVEGWRHHDPHYGFYPSAYALIFGIVSGLSLPLGAAAGIWLAPVRSQTFALMTAFGAGALLFAVTIELYAHALSELEKGKAGLLEMFTMIFGALLGAAFYLTINQWLKDGFPVTDVEVEASMEISESEISPMSKLLKAEESSETDSSDEGESSPMMTALRSVERYGVIRNKSTYLSAPRQRVIRLISEEIHSARSAFDGQRKGLPLPIGIGIFFGLLADGIPEGILMGLFCAEGHLSPVLIVSLFVANFPEAFAAGSIMSRARLATTTILSLWTGLCLLIGCLCGLSCYLLLFFFPDYVAYSIHKGQIGDAPPVSVLVGVAFIEGVTGGAMLAYMSAVMLPEALARSKKNRPFWSQTGFLCGAGFLMSMALKTIFG